MIGNYLKGCLLILTAVQVARAQNLVPDSSFEMNTFVPMDFSAINASLSWNTPSRGTSDLFCKCSRKTKLLTEKIYSLVDVPQNLMGYQYPHSGTCYAGFFLFSHGDYREYLQTPLAEPLVKNKTYLLTFYISLADYSRTSIDQLGVCFLAQKKDYSFSDVITDLDPVYINIEREMGSDTEDWHPVTATYKASGGERYLLLGSFEVNKVKRTKLTAPKEIKSRINQATERDAYYFVDDVSLVELYSEDEANPPVHTEEDTVDALPSNTLLVLKNVLFETNETQLLPSSYSELDELAGYLNTNVNNLIEIFGHTDNSGNEKANKELSLGRAKAVADYLVLKGISTTRITYKGFGSLNPVSTNHTEEGKQHNRRVEFRIGQK